MADGLLDWFSELSRDDPLTLHGLMMASVVDNMDLTGLGRVQISLWGYPDVTPWAKVASPFAGSDYGFYAMPQTGDNVIVGFERGDPAEPVVLGGFWTTSAMPPAGIPQTDPQYKRVLKTPKGHNVVLDDMLQTITITTTTDQEIAIGPKEIEVKAGKGAAKVTISTAGEITISGTTQVSVKAPAVSVEAQGSLKLSGASVTIQATGACAISGGTVTIN
jgi:uncharacterized protein involved in type VI secretion and phage assembly